MRPETLNPLFIEIDALDGVGPKLRKPLEKLGLERIKDLAYHLPDRFVLRRAVDNLDRRASASRSSSRSPRSNIARRPVAGRSGCWRRMPWAISAR